MCPNMAIISPPTLPTSMLILSRCNCLKLDKNQLLAMVASVSHRKQGVGRCTRLDAYRQQDREREEREKRLELERRRVIIKEIMENILKLSIPLKVNFKTGHRWGELE